MRLKFLELPSEERRLYLEEAAGRRNVSSVMLEKDFWVCWLLAVLFESRFGFLSVWPIWSGESTAVAAKEK